MGAVVSVVYNISAVSQWMQVFCKSGASVHQPVTDVPMPDHSETLLQNLMAVGHRFYEVFSYY